MTLTRKELEKIQKEIKCYIEHDAIKCAIDDIKSRVPSFNIDFIYSYLKELHNSDPSRAELLNNPAGWELIWLRGDYKGKKKLPWYKKILNKIKSLFTKKQLSTHQELINKIKDGKATTLDRMALLEKYL